MHKALVETLVSFLSVSLDSARCLKQTKLHGDSGFLSASFPFTLITH